jgi:hypothetical protein
MDGLKYREHQDEVWTCQLDDIWSQVRQVRLYGHWRYTIQDME